MEENINNMSYLTLLQEIKGKNIDEAFRFINNIQGFVPEKSAMDEFLIVEEVVRRINLCDTTDCGQYSFLKRSIIYFCALENYTNFDISSLDMGMENFDICLEMALKKNELIAHYYQVVEDVLRQQELTMIRELDNLFKKMPSIQDLDEMQNKLKNMFSEESDDKLKLIEGILAYNDPTMKIIKDTMLNMDAMTEENKKDIKMVANKTTTLLEKELKKDGEISNGDKSK